MPNLRYLYRPYPGDTTPQPLVVAVAINLLNGRERNFLGILDTGADQSALSSDLLSSLGVEPDLLDEIEVGVVGGMALVGFCNFIRLGVKNPADDAVYFPNGREAVPLHFHTAPFNLLGRQDFLNLCRATFDGPRGTVDLDW